MVTSPAYGPGSGPRPGQPGEPTDHDEAAREPGEHKLVYRIADVEDSHAWLIALADKGERSLVDHRRDLGEALAPLFSGLDDAA